jgi:hypothetical protein
MTGGSADITDDPGNMTAAPPDPSPDLGSVAARLGAEVRSDTVDGDGWRWRVRWRGVEVGAWNDIDGVAVVADIGPWDEWVGLRDHPPDPSDVEALEWAVAVLGPWLEDSENARRVADRAAERGRAGDDAGG